MRHLSSIVRTLTVTVVLMGSVLWVSVSGDRVSPLIGPGPNGGAPYIPPTINPIAYWLVGIIVATPWIYAAYRVWKSRMAKHK